MTQAAVARPRLSAIDQSWLRWLPILGILIAAVLIRVPMLTLDGFPDDTHVFKQWTNTALQSGLLGVYSVPLQPLSVDHPPIGVSLLTFSAKVFETLGLPVTDDTTFLIAFKVPILLCDLLMIGIVYLIINREAGQKWALIGAAAVAFTPALVADSVWWGQTDNLFSLFLLLTVYALHRRWYLAAWLFYALTMLSKFQGVMLLPLLLVLTWRRAGWRVLLEGIGVLALVMGLVLAPFMMSSGASAALRPYLEGSNKYPRVTMKAENFWAWVLSSTYDMTQPWYRLPFDTEVQVGPLTARIIGYLLFGLAAALILLRTWLLPQREDEFLLAAGLYAAFFMLFTQMHERYIYPTVILLIPAMIGRRGIMLLWAGFAIMATHNILLIASRTYPLWEAIWPIIDWPVWVNAGIGVALLVLLLISITLPLRIRLALPSPLAERGWG